LFTTPLAAVVLVLWTPLAASAQTGSERIGEARKAARAHLGSLYFSPVLNVDYIGVDDNVFFDSQTGNPQSDFLAIVTPQVRGWLPVANRLLVSTTVSPRIEYYRKFVNARTVVPQISLRGDLFLGRIALFGSGQMQQGRNRPNFEIDSRTLYRTTGLNGGISYRVRARLFVDVSAYRSETRFNAMEVFLGTRLRDTLDQRDQGLRLELRRRLSTKTTARLTADTIRSTFQFSPDRNSSGYRVTAGAEFLATALIAGSARVGFRQFTPANPAIPGYTGLTGDADLSYTLLGATRFTGRWKRDLTYSYQQAQPYYIMNGVGGSIRRQLAGRFDVIVGADRDVSSYRNLSSAPASVARVDINTAYTADLGMRINRLSRVGFAVSQTDRRSNAQSSRDYTRRRMGLSFTYGS
jgi:hypothetical protein